MTYQLVKLQTVRDHIANELSKVHGHMEDLRQMEATRRKKITEKAAWRLKLEAK